MSRILIAALALACMAAPAFAQAAGAAHETTVLTIWWGQAVIAFSNAFLEAAAPLVASFLFAFLVKQYPVLKMFISEKVVNDQVNQFVHYAENAEAGALKGAHYDIDVGRSVLGTAVAHGLEQGKVSLIASKAVKWAGGPEQIAKRAFAKLNLKDGASAAAVLVPILRQLENGTLIPEKIATVKVVPARVPTVKPTAKILPKLAPKKPVRG